MPFHKQDVRAKIVAESHLASAVWMAMPASFAKHRTWRAIQRDCVCIDHGNMFAAGPLEESVPSKHRWANRRTHHEVRQNIDPGHPSCLSVMPSGQDRKPLWHQLHEPGSQSLSCQAPGSRGKHRNRLSPRITIGSAVLTGAVSALTLSATCVWKSMICGSRRFPRQLHHEAVSRPPRRNLLCSN